MKRKPFFPFFLVLALAGMLAGCGPKQDDSYITKTSYLLNTVVTINLYDSTDEAILEGCFDLIQDYESRLSRTLEDSEISRLNRGELTQVSPETAQLIQKGLDYGRLSGGAFDIAIEPVSSLWDFSSGTDTPSLPDPQLLEAALEKVNYEDVQVNGNEIIFGQEGMGLDLGAIAKGYIADRVKDYLLSEGVASATINLGGNILCVGEKPSGQPFKIGIQKPFAASQETIGYVEVADISVVSSGIYERYITVDGKQYHHLLNPETGYSYENELTSVTILSPASVDGDGLSTSCFCLGLEKGMELINSIPDCYGIFITKDDDIYYSEGLQDVYPVTELN